MTDDPRKELREAAEQRSMPAGWAGVRLYDALSALLAERGRLVAAKGQMSDTDPWRELQEAANGDMIETCSQSNETHDRICNTLNALLAERDRLELANSGMAVEYDHVLAALRKSEERVVEAEAAYVRWRAEAVTHEKRVHEWEAWWGRAYDSAKTIGGHHDHGVYAYELSTRVFVDDRPPRATLAKEATDD